MTTISDETLLLIATRAGARDAEALPVELGVTDDVEQAERLMTLARPATAMAIVLIVFFPSMILLFSVGDTVTFGNVE
jgi:hypothetical protein